MLATAPWREEREYAVYVIKWPRSEPEANVRCRGLSSTQTVSSRIGRELSER